jgi:PEP-CTERM motif
VKLKVPVIFIALLAFLLFSGVSLADSIAIQNSSFEDTNPLAQACGTGCAFNNGPIPDWTITGGQAGTALLSSYYPGGIPDGSIVAFSNGGTISQTLTGTELQANSTYVLSVFVGDRPDNEVSDYSFSLYAGSTLLGTFSGSNSSITPGTFAQEFLTYTTGSTVAAGDLTIDLASAGIQTDFDNVQLTVNPADYPAGDPPVSTPEPGTLLMLGSGIFGMLGFAFRKASAV